MQANSGRLRQQGPLAPHWMVINRPVHRKSSPAIRAATLVRAEKGNARESQMELLQAPRLPGSLPVVGHVFELLRLEGSGPSNTGLCELFAKCAKEVGPVSAINLFGNEIIFVNDSELVGEITVKRQEEFKERFVPPGIKVAYNSDIPGINGGAASEMDAKGVVFANGDHHKVHRTIALKSLVQKETKAQIEAYVYEKAEKLRERFLRAPAEGLRVDLEARRFTIDVIGEVLFSFDFGQLDSASFSADDDAEFVQKFDSTLVAINNIIVKDPIGLWKLFDTKDMQTMREDMGWLAEFEEKIIQERMEKYDRTGEAGHDFLGALLAAKGSDGQRLPMRDIRWSVHDMFAAGNDTTTSSITAALGLVAVHQDVQTALQEELQVLEGRLPKPEDLEQLPLLQAVVRETLRLYPAGHVFARVCTSGSTSLGSYDIPERSAVYASPWIIHRTEKYWKDPEKFDPARFLPGGEWSGVGGDTPRMAYIPFGAGGRACVGGTLAMLEMQVALAAILQACNLRTKSSGGGCLPDGSLNIYYDITLSFPEGLTLLVEPRNNTAACEEIAASFQVLQ